MILLYLVAKYDIIISNCNIWYYVLQQNNDIIISHGNIWYYYT